MGPFKPKDEEERRKERDRKREEELQKDQEEFDHKLKVRQQKYDFKTVLEKLKFETYTKRLVGIVIAVCLIDMQLSYVLAFMGRIDIAEDLSSNICQTVIGVSLVYMIRAYFDTKAEKNNEKSTINKDMEDKIMDQVRTVFSNANIDLPSDIDKFTAAFNTDKEEPAEEVAAPEPVEETVSEEPTITTAETKTEYTDAVG